MSARFTQKVENALIKQVGREAYASQLYLSLASWAEANGFPGVASFLYDHSQEEREHMLKIIAFVNQRGGYCIIDAVDAPPPAPKTLHQLFDLALEQEICNSTEINNIVDICRAEKDYATDNFLQWFVKEQIEEEALVTQIIDQLKIIGEDQPNRGGLYEFDRHINDSPDAELARDAS